MINKKGSILSPVNILTNKKQGDNFLIFKNIIQEPIHQIFKGYFVDLKKRKKVCEFNLKTNLTNFIKIDNQILENDIYFLTDNYQVFLYIYPIKIIIYLLNILTHPMNIF